MTERAREIAEGLQEDDECSWCGAEPAPHANREGEKFCSFSHRKQSNAARRALQKGEEE